MFFNVMPKDCAGSYALKKCVGLTQSIERKKGVLKLTRLVDVRTRTKYFFLGF